MSWVWRWHCHRNLWRFMRCCFFPLFFIQNQGGSLLRPRRTDCSCCFWCWEGSVAYIRGSAHVWCCGLSAGWSSCLIFFPPADWSKAYVGWVLVCLWICYCDPSRRWIDTWLGYDRWLIVFLHHDRIIFEKWKNCWSLLYLYPCFLKEYARWPVLIHLIPPFTVFEELRVFWYDLRLISVDFGDNASLWIIY